MKTPVDKELVFCLQAVQLGLCDARTLVEVGLAWSRGDAESLRAELLARSAAAAGSAALVDQTVELIVAAQRAQVPAALESLGGGRLESLGGAGRPLESLGGAGRPLESLGGAAVVVPRDPSTLAPSPIPGTVPGDATAAVTPEQPGRYSLRGELGRGGIGKVLAAFDEHVGREVAIKELLVGESVGSSTGTGARSAVATARFLREARLTGQLEHPSIVPVYEVGRRTDGTLYYAMRMVRGRTMAAAIGAARGLEERLALLPHFGSLCAAVAYAHSRGVLHRDLKPLNVMIGEFGETVVLDWGLAKIRGDAEGEDRRFARQMELLRQAAAGNTVDGEAMGTPEYMPPEQAWGELSRVDETSDVYSLGAVLYELLTGRPPFVGDVAFEIIGRVQRYGEGKERLTPVSALEPTAPPELAAIAQKALAAVPAERYPSAKALLDDVSAFMAGRRVGAYDYSPWELVRRLVRRHRIAAAFAAALLVALVGGSAVLARAWQVADVERAQAEANERLAHRHLADGYQEKSEQLVRAHDLLGARIFAAASLAESPFNPVGRYHDAALAAGRPEAAQSQLASLQSTLWATRQGVARHQAKIDHGSAVGQLAFAPDGSWIATAGRGSGVSLWNAADGAALRKLDSEATTALAVSADGALLAAASSQKQVRLWSVADGAGRGALPTGASPADALWLSPDGGRLLAAARDGTLLWWNLKSGALAGSTRVAEIEPGTGFGAQASFEFSRDGRLLVIGGATRDLTIWSVTEGRELATVENRSQGLRAMSLSPDARFLVTTGDDHTLRLFSLPTGELLDIVALGDLQPRALEVRYGPEGPLWAAVSHGEEAAEIVEFSTGRRLALLRGHRGAVRALALSADGETLVTGGADGGARLWRMATARQHRFASTKAPLRAVALAGARAVAALGEENGAASLWDLEKGVRLALPPGLEGATALGLSRDASKLAVAQQERVRVFALPEGRELWSVEGSARRLTFSPDGATLAVGERDAPLRLFDAADGRLRATLAGKVSSATASEFSPDGRLLAVGGRGKLVELWDPAGPALVRTLETGEETISTLAFSPDGSTLAVAGGSWAIGLWEPRGGRQIGSLKGHTSAVRRLFFSADGKLLVSAGLTDGTARLWSTGEQRMLQLFAPRNGCRAAFFAPGGRLVFNDGLDLLSVPLELDLWREDPAQLLQAAQRDAGLRLEGFSLVPD